MPFCWITFFTDSIMKLFLWLPIPIWYWIIFAAFISTDGTGKSNDGKDSSAFHLHQIYTSTHRRGCCCCIYQCVIFYPFRYDGVPFCLLLRILFYDFTDSIISKFEVFAEPGFWILLPFFSFVQLLSFQPRFHSIWNVMIWDRQNINIYYY